jgi:hypothetical protein
LDVVLNFGLFGASHESAKIKHAKLKQTPKIKTTKSAIGSNTIQSIDVGFI